MKAVEVGKRKKRLGYCRVSFLCQRVCAYFLASSMSSPPLTKHCSTAALRRACVVMFVSTDLIRSAR